MFTDEVTTNVVISGGKIEITATSKLSGAWSANRDDNSKSDDIAAVNGIYTFTAGGTASMADGAVKLENIVPGDGVQVTVDIANTGTVNAKYRVVVSAGEEDEGLFEALEISVVNGLTDDEWHQLNVGESMENGITIDIELPITVGDDYQGLLGSVDIAVKAVQANAHIDDESEDDLPTHSSGKAPVTGSHDTEITTEDGKLTVVYPGDALWGDEEEITLSYSAMDVSDKYVTGHPVTEGGKALYYDFDLKIDGSTPLIADEEYYFTVKLYIGKGEDPSAIKVYRTADSHQEDSNGNLIVVLAASEYDPATGILTVKTYSVKQLIIVLQGDLVGMQGSTPTTPGGDDLDDDFIF